MKPFHHICLAVIGLALVACSHQTDVAKTEPSKNTPLVSISTDKKMVPIEGGTYKAFIGQDSGKVVKVASFYMDETPVTNAEYLRFLKANPQWSKNQVLRLYADSTYLKGWENGKIPAGVSPDAAVTNVSWFAAEAYAKSVGKRLPTVDEWEYVGLADAHRKNASADPAFTYYILKAYQDKSRKNHPVKQGKPNVYGVYDLYGPIWEWIYDFNSVMMSGESRKDNTTNESLFCAGAAVTSSDLRNYAAFIRYALRGSVKANYTLNNMGFRCVKN